jgi:ferrous iron transport protein B
LGRELGTPVLPLVASKGRGVKAVFLHALEVGKNGAKRKQPAGGGAGALVTGIPAEASETRHALARALAHRFVSQGERRVSLRDRLDDVLLHPIWGYAILLFVLLLFFQAVYGIGQLIEPPLLAFFETLTRGVVSPFGTDSLLSEILVGVLQGIAAGIAIVLPYLLPFLFGLGVLEDIGYLPRVAFLMDALMHRIGLHGKAIVPFILGYGCNVPAVMSTRTLEEPRDRYLAAALATLVPCAARLAVVFGLVAFYLGPLVAFALYLFNLLVIALTGRILSSLMPEDTPGLILEMPTYRIPTLKNVTGKAWFRVREFVVEAWPILIVGSAILAALNYFNAAVAFNWLVRPLTWSLGLPSEVGVPLIFGILRKELSLVMLGQALGTVNFDTALSIPQMVTYATFVMFYLPCLATLSVLRRELGTRAMLAIAALTVVVAQFAAWIAWGVTELWL